jgi:non-reducing end alpha-L-arabinofuranosidase
MVRVLSGKYGGPLYQVRSGSSSKNTGTGGTTQDILAVNGLADTDTQDALCSGSTCTVSILYDQSGNGNHLTVAKRGCGTGTASEDDYESSATRRALTVGGHKVYALYMNAHEAYRNNQTTSMPTGAAAQGIYELADGSHSGTGCCWDFGNASTDNCYGSGSLNALFFGADAWAKGAGGGPWFMGDAGGGTWPDDSGVWACGTSCSNAIPSMAFDYAFGTLNTEPSKGALRGGDARSGDLFTIYDGQVQAKWSMEGGIVLGLREDNSNSAYGTFYEGAITSGRPSSTTDTAVFKNVQAAGYGK